MRAACADVHAWVAAGAAPFDGIDQLDGAGQLDRPEASGGTVKPAGTAAAWFAAGRAQSQHHAIPSTTSTPTTLETP